MKTPTRLAVVMAFAGLLAACSHSPPPVAAVPVVVPPDSVSAAETARLRAIALSYQSLRDSLAVMPPASSAEALATMEQVILFDNDQADLTKSAQAVLNDKVTIFEANPAMRIVIVGFASEPGAKAYNMALGLRRAEVAKAYLVAQGIDPIRIEIATRGEEQPAVAGHSQVANAANRRGQFRLLMADPYLVTPKP